jgi:hypothetical protein
LYSGGQEKGCHHGSLSNFLHVDFSLDACISRLF